MPGSRWSTRSSLHSRHFQFFVGDLLGEMKQGAPSVVGRGPQTSAMRLDSGAADRQTHTGAPGLFVKNVTEDLIRLFNRQSYTGAAD